MNSYRPSVISWKIFLLLLALASPAAALAHGGEDHGAEAAPAMALDIAPRATSETEEFELVAVPEGKKLVLYLDRFDTNAPVADARIEVESGAFKAVATEAAPGVYWLPGEAFAAPAKYPLTISVQAGESADLLTATLDLTKPAAGAGHARSREEWAVWGASGALLLAGAGFVIARRRKNRKH